MLRVKDVARILDVSPASVYALCAAGKLRHYRIGAARGALRFEKKAVDDYLAAARVEGPGVWRFRGGVIGFC